MEWMKQGIYRDMKLFGQMGMARRTQEAVGDSKDRNNMLSALNLSLGSDENILKINKYISAISIARQSFALLIGLSVLFSAFNAESKTLKMPESKKSKVESSNSKKSTDRTELKASAKTKKTVTRIDPVTGEKIIEKATGDWKAQGIVASTISSTINQDDDLYDQSLGLSVRGTVSYVPQQIELTLSTDMSQELTYEPADGRDTRFGNINGGISKVVKVPWMDFSSVGIDGTLGTSQSSVQAEFLGGLGVNFFTSKRFGKFLFSQFLSYQYSFYEFDITIAGTVNRPHAYTSSTGLRYSPIKKLTLSTGLAFTHTVSFQDVGRTLTTASFAASYRFIREFSATIGFRSRQNGLDPSGQNYEYDFLDPRDAVTYLSLSMTI